MSTVDLNDPSNLSQVLVMLSANDTKVIKNGEKILKPFLKKRTCVLPLMAQLEFSPEPAIRHHAALLLKSKMGSFISQFAVNERTEIKNKTISLFLSETQHAICNGIAGSIASMAKSLFATNDSWPELFSLMIQLCQDTNEKHRLLNFNLLEQLSEQVAFQLKPHTETIGKIFVMGCQDSSHSVQVAALKATGSYISALANEDEVMILKDVLSPMLQVMHVCLQKGDEEIVSEALDVIQECCMSDQALINDHIEMISAFTVNIMQGADYDSSVKQSAGLTLMQIIEFRPKLFAAKQLVSPTMAALMEMIAKEKASVAGSLFAFSNNDVLDEEDGDDDDEDYTPAIDTQKMCQQIIDTMAISIPSKHFVDQALVLCGQGVASTDPQMRKAGCAVLGVIAEGCQDRIREVLSDILPRVLALMQDQEFYVRETACFALGQFSEYCQPDILYFNSSILPVVFNSLNDPQQSVQSTSCYVLEVFCENLQPATLRPYLDSLMTKLLLLLQNGNRMMKEMALTAIAACALAAEIDVLPYTEGICNIIGGMIFESNPKLFSLRGRAMECLGHIAVAIGHDHFSRYFGEGMRSAVQGIQINDETLKEHSYVYIANTAQVMAKSFEPYMDSLVPHLLEVIGESELLAFGDHGDDDDEEEEDDGDADVTSDDLNGNMRINIQEGFINTKKSALTALSALAEHTKELFYPYLVQVFPKLLQERVGSICSLHDAIRGETYSALQHLVTCTCWANGVPVKPEFGQVLSLPPAVVDVARIMLVACIACLETDESRKVVAEAITSISGIYKNLGMAAANIADTDNSSLANRLMHAIHKILIEKAPCQTIDKYEADGDNDEDDDHDNVVMDTITDLIGVLAKVLQANFIPFFDEFQKPLMKFMKPNRLHSDRAMAIGCFAEVIAEIGAGATKYVPTILPAIMTGVSDKMEGVRRNSAFCVGVLVQSTGTLLKPDIMNILHKLHPICVRKESKSSDSGGADIDNAIAAVARIINTLEDNDLPLSQILPVVVNALPLQEDTSEGPVIYQCLATLVLKNNPDALKLLPLILNVVGATLLPSSGDVKETKFIATTFLQSLPQQPNYREVVLPAVAAINNVEVSSVLHQLLTV